MTVGYWLSRFVGFFFEAFHRIFISVTIVLSAVTYCFLLCRGGGCVQDTVMMPVPMDGPHIKCTPELEIALSEIT